ncbi:OmpH family outer membrane protein [bacterium]|nr:OmpH family outer membrane protein [bacterium]
MSHFSKTQTRVLAMLLGAALAGSAAGQAKLGYVDSPRILASYGPALDAQKKLDGENTQWVQELQKMQEDLQTMQQKLEQQSLLLSDAKKRESAQELQNLALKAQQFQQDHWGDQGKFFQRRGELLQPVFDKINEVINKVGEEGGYDFIFDTQAGNLLYAKSSHDLTADILARLEKESASTAGKAKN